MAQKIAFIDDEASVLESVKWVFKNEPYTLFTFRNPEEALEKIEEDEFAVVVTDQVMPIMEGSLLIEQIKKKRPRTECFIMTAHANIDTGNIVDKKIIRKPWDVEELKSIIQNAVSLYESGDQAPAEPEAGRTRILYVEDNEDLIDLMDKVLRRLGYFVVITSLCSEAVRLMQSQPDMFDLVITDMKMPDMDGLELSGKLRESRPDIPVILSTGQSDLVLSPEMKAVGIKAIMPKPFSVEDIARVIQQTLESAE